jgi:hypothetical protein
MSQGGDKRRRHAPAMCAGCIVRAAARDLHALEPAVPVLGFALLNCH